MQRDEPPQNAFFTKLPKVKKSSIQHKWMLGGKHRNKFVLDNHTTFYIHFNFIHNKHQGGSHGFITPGYNSRTSIIESYVAKVEKSPKLAQHEAKYHQMLGRQAYWFIWQDAEVLLTEWQHGLQLFLLSTDYITSLTYMDRLYCIFACLTELCIFHNHGCAHGDIAPRNLILDIEKLKLSLIDFGSSSKASTETMLTDIDRLASCLKIMFPEIYNSHYQSRQLTIVEQGIESLILHMTTQNNSLQYAEPCTAKQALQLCEDLIVKHQELDEDLLQKIAHQHRSPALK